MAANRFCTSCGAELPASAGFCTACGVPQAGAAVAPSAPSASAPRASTPTTAIAVAALMLALGGGATWIAFQQKTDIPRAVPGAPGGGGGMGQMGQQAGGDGGALPSGHPNIELPKEVTDFLDGLAADAEKNPQSVEAAAKLMRARYRASVINPSYRASAEQALDKLMALDPKNAEGLRVAANLAYDSENFPDAEKRFEAYLEVRPDDVTAITDLGSTQLFQDRTDQAIATYERAITKDPKFMQARFNLGIALQKQGKKDEALASLKQAMELAENPDEKQHVEDAIAEIEGRKPQQIPGASAAMGGMPAGAPPGGGMPPGGMAGAAPGGMAGGMPGSAPGGMPSGMPGAMPPPAPDREVPTNATSDFQRAAEKPFITHPIVGPRVVSFDWTGPTAGRVKIANFPMDKMPPFARQKFESTIQAKLAEVATANGVAEPVKIEFVDDASGSVMDTLESGPPAGAATSAAPGGAK